MLQQHIHNCEKLLLEAYEIASIAGHNVHKGDSREMFVKDFLKDNLPQAVSIGAGEVIDHKSRPSDNRNQMDVVLYRKDIPKIALGGNRNAYLIESVCSTIEVKSTLKYSDIKQAVKAAYAIKSLKRTNYFQKGNYLYCGVLAYKCRCKMSKVVEWIKKAEKAVGVKALSQDAINYGYVAPSIDGVVILGKGIIHYSNPHVGLVPPPNTTSYRWIYSESTDCHSLLVFFLQILRTIPNIMTNAVSYLHYVSDGSVYSPIVVS